MLNKKNKIKINDNIETKQMNKNALISKWSICMFFLFLISFFVGIKIYQIKMPVNAARLDKKSRLTSGEMNKREGKVSPTCASEAQAFNPYKNNGKKIAYLTFDDGPSKKNTRNFLCNRESC